MLIRALRYDKTPAKSWECIEIAREGSLIVFRGEFDREITHDQIGTIEKGTVSLEYYWLDRWYNVFRFLSPAGSHRCFYCNINMPPKIDGDTLEYVDLDLDVYVGAEGEIKVLDREEFAENSRKFSYPAEIVRTAESALGELLRHIASGDFPFEK